MGSTALPSVLLAVYAILTLPVIFVMFRHGIRHGAILGWLYLFAFCSLRLVSSSLELSDTDSYSASVVASIGLSPLLLASSGILHESRAYLDSEGRRMVESIWVIKFHLFVTAALALVAAGASKLNRPDNDADATRSLNLVKGGMAILLFAWLFLVTLSILTLVVLRRGSTVPVDHRGGNTLLLGVSAAMPFIGIRLLTSLVSYFSQSPALDPSSGNLGLRVGLEIVEEIVVVVIFIVVGVMTRDIGKKSLPITESAPRNSVKTPV
ncbi:hypothetical protein F5Y15DRAFT_49502 [Xylariaceae sp. FL0016]|nr:hypothetical protein F5Y15DRAFT_49502 [Xylariaceae sp. FL0016]